MRIQADFGTLLAAQHNVKNTLAQFQQQSDTWRLQIQQLMPDLDDGTGQTNLDVHAIFNQMDTAHSQMLAMIDGAIGNTHQHLSTAVSQASSGLSRVSFV